MQPHGSLLGAVRQLLLLAAMKLAEPIVGEVVGNDSSSLAPTPSNSVLYVAAFFPTNAVDSFTREMLGMYPRVAAEMAVNHINERGVLPYRLKMTAIETGCSSSESAFGLVQVLREQPPCAIIGPACETPAIILGGITSRNIGVVEVSYAAQSPLLSRVDEYPYFFRTVPSCSSYGETIYAIMRHFDWLDVSVVHEATSTYTLALEEISVLLREKDSRINIEDSFFIDGLSDVPKGVGRIFVGLFPESRAADIMCTAYRRGLTGVEHLWILLGEFYDGWWQMQRAQCSSDELQSALESTLIVTHSLRHLDHNDTTVSGLTPWEFWRSYSSMVQDTLGLEFQPENFSSRVPAAYDAVWSVALAANRSLERIQEDGDILATCNSGCGSFNSMLREAMENLSFVGVSGEVRFSPSQHSATSLTTTITQIQSGNLVPVGVYNSEQDFLNMSTFGNNLIWQGGRPPLDRPNIELQVVDLWVVGIMLFLAGVCIIFAVTMLAIDWLYRKHKVIKASSPYINLLIIAGVLIGCCSVVVISLDSRFVGPHNDQNPHNVYTVLCNVRPWTYSLSFTLAFGAIFFKTCRLYAIFRNPWSQKRHFKDVNLVLMVLGLLAVDALILSIWMVVDPLAVTDVLVNQQSQAFVRVIELHEVCSSEQMYVWIVLVVLPKGILLLLGMFLVKLTGKIKVKVFKGAKYTGIAIYGVVFSCSVGVPSALITMFSNEEDVTYVAATGTILTCSYLILTMVFVPKLVLLWRYKRRIPTAVLWDLNPNYRSRQQVTTSQSAKLSSSKQLSKFNTSSVQALHDGTTELEDAWEAATVELPNTPLDDRAEDIDYHDL